MKNNKFFLPVILISVLFITMLCCMLIQIFQPAVIIPPLNIPNIVLISIAALLIEHFISQNSPRCYICALLFGAGAFAALPLLAGFACVHDFWKIGLVGGVTFALTTYLFTSAAKRLKTGPQAPAALILTCL